MSKVKRCFLFNEEYISCNSCAKNYRADNGAKGFCQEFSMLLNPNDKEHMHNTGLNCKQWIPEFADRSKMHEEEENERWYESKAWD